MINPDSNIDVKVSEILSGLTIEEKIGQLHQSGSYDDTEKDLIRLGRIGSLLNFCGSDAISGIQTTITNSISKIPLIIGDDVIHGYNTGFPIPLAESCSFDLELIEETAAIAGKEASDQGVNMIFAPMVDISHEPRWGRVAEGAGEDPYYGSLVAAARVKGLQRNNERGYPQVAACPKHYIGYGASEGGRDYDYTEISDFTLYNTYLQPFRAAVDAGALSIMSSFNDVSGRPASLSKYLLTDVLRGDLGFEGMVLSDWESVQHGVAHGVAADRSEAAMLGLLAGCDMDMHSEVYRKNIAGLMAEDKLTMADLDRAVGRVLRTKAKLGLLDGTGWINDNNTGTTPEDIAAVVRNPKHVETAGRMARKSVVLLKNESNLLPLSESIRSIAVIGELAASREHQLGCWQCKTNKDNVVSIVDGIKGILGASTEFVYSRGCGVTEAVESEIVQAVETAGRCDVAVVVLGEYGWMSGENNSRAFLDLHAPQKELLRRVLAANPKTILVLMNGRPLTLSWEDKFIPSIVEAWQLGDEAGNAIADILFGRFNPCGRLTITFPRSVGQVPIYYNRRNSGRPELIRYIDEEITPLYPFGYGLTYSQFEYSDINLSSKNLRSGSAITASVSVTNKSGPKGEETVQMYIQDVVSSVTRPIRELKGFVKLDLEPGETATASFEITPEMLAFYDHDLKPLIEKGLFRIYIGSNSTCESFKEFNLL